MEYVELRKGEEGISVIVYSPHYIVTIAAARLKTVSSKHPVNEPCIPNVDSDNIRAMAIIQL